MDFVKLQKQLEEGKKLSLRYKDGSTVFSHNPPLKLYPLILKTHPDVGYWVDSDGANPLFFVDSAKKFEYLVQYGFDIYVRDKDGVGLDDILDVSLFDTLSLKALRKFSGKDQVFQEYVKKREASTEQDDVLEDILEFINTATEVDIDALIEAFPDVEFGEEMIEALLAFGGDDEDSDIFNAYIGALEDRDFTFRILNTIKNGTNHAELEELLGEIGFAQDLFDALMEAVGDDQDTIDLVTEAFGGNPGGEGDSTTGTTSGKRLLHSKMIGHMPGEDNTSVHTPHSNDHDWVFTTDAHNVYKTYTTKEGYQMLESLADQLEPVLSSLRNTPGFNEQEGFKIYTEKENLKTGATWSDEEYANPSFLYWYCLNKAVQRFPETIEMMNSAVCLNTLNHYHSKKVTNATIVSLGGGCSYELLAVKAVFKKHFPHVKLRLVSLDYEPLWGKIVEPLGIEFDTIDFNKPVGELQEQLDKYNADFYVMSFVYRTYIKQRHEAFIKYLCKSSFGIFINDRNNEYLSFGMMTYRLSSSGFLTLISDQFEGYPYVESLSTSGYPPSIYKDTPWVKPSTAVRTSGERKAPGGDRVNPHARPENRGGPRDSRGGPRPDNRGNTRR